MHAVIFDIDGTLLNSIAVDDRFYRQSVFEILGNVETRASWTDYPHVTDAGILAAILADNETQNPQAMMQAVRDRFSHYLSEYVANDGAFDEIPGARKFVAYLNDHPQCRIAIATGCWRHSALLKLESAGFDVDDIPVATADDHPERTEIMLTALTALGASHDSVTYYGDGVWDREACARLGWNFIPVGQKLSGLDSFHDIEACLPGALRL